MLPCFSLLPNGCNTTRMTPGTASKAWRNFLITFSLSPADHSGVISMKPWMSVFRYSKRPCGNDQRCMTNKNEQRRHKTSACHGVVRTRTCGLSFRPLVTHFLREMKTVTKHIHKSLTITEQLHNNNTQTQCITMEDSETTPHAC